MEPSPGPPPDQSRWANSRWRAVLFWLIMVLLGVVLWKMASTPAPTGTQMGYSDFLSNVDRKNIQAATIFLTRDAAEVRGRLRDTGKDYSAIIPRETLPTLIAALREQSSAIDVRETHENDRLNLVMNFLPLIILVALWIFMMRRMQGKGRGI
jgi:cell division protease FtsH